MHHPHKRSLAIISGFLLILIFSKAMSAGAQQATPTTGCDVVPRTVGELQTLAAAPAPSPIATMATPAATPVGEPADAATVAELERTLQMTQACAEANDVLRLLALYSDRFIVDQVLSAEPVPIVQGTPSATPTSVVGIPPAIGNQPVVQMAQLLSDGRAVALVQAGDQREIVLFVRDQQRGSWVIDEVEHLVELGHSSTADQPAEAHLARADAAAHLGVAEGTLTVARIEPKQWPDASLGCPKPGEFYAQVVTPGYLIVIHGPDHVLEYHTDQRGNVILCSEHSS